MYRSLISRFIYLCRQVLWFFKSGQLLSATMHGVIALCIAGLTSLYQYLPLHAGCNNQISS